MEVKKMSKLELHALEYDAPATFIEGALALLEYARKIAIRPEPKSLTRFDPMVAISELERFCGESICSNI